MIARGKRSRLMTTCCLWSPAPLVRRKRAAVSTGWLHLLLPAVHRLKLFLSEKIQVLPIICHQINKNFGSSRINFDRANILNYFHWMTPPAAARCPQVEGCLFAVFVWKKDKILPLVLPIICHQIFKKFDSSKINFDRTNILNYFHWLPPPAVIPPPLHRLDVSVK